MTVISNLPPSGGNAAGVQASVLPQAIEAAAAAATASPTAKLLLPSAVVASNFVPAYVADPPKQSKPTLRAMTASASSQLAAQFIDQTPDATPEQLAIFNHRAPEETEVESASVEAALTPAMENNPATASSVKEEAEMTRNGLIMLEPAVIPLMPKKTGLVLARGVSAYVLAERRNYPVDNLHAIEPAVA